MREPIDIAINQIREDLTQAYLSVFKDVKDELMKPGYIYGNECAELEAVFRPFHLISIAPDLDKSKFYDYKAYFNNELSELLDPKHSRFAGVLEDFDPKLNEASNLAFHFFVNASSWDFLDEKNQIAFLNWISTASGCATKRNNWILFRGMLGLFHAIKTSSSIPDWTTEDFRTVLPWIQENGWVQDGQVAPIDFYTGYVFYPFLLIGIKYGVFSASEEKLVFSGLRHWANQIQQMTDPQGRIPLFGRSLIYRFAFLSPFLLARRLFNISLVSNEVLGAIVQNYMSQTPASFGILTLGVFGAKHEVAEDYSIRASAYWLARALIPPSASSGISDPPQELVAHSYWEHKIKRGQEQTYVINVNKKFKDSSYFQHILDSENSLLRMSSFGTFQRLAIRKGRLVWKTVMCRLIPNSHGSSDPLQSKLSFSFKHPGIYRIGWNNKVTSPSMFRLARLTRTSRFHIRLSQFRFKEHFFLSLKPATIDICIS
jgi:hypothetical protein